MFISCGLLRMWNCVIFFLNINKSPAKQKHYKLLFKFSRQKCISKITDNALENLRQAYFSTESERFVMLYSDMKNEFISTIYRFDICNLLAMNAVFNKYLHIDTFQILMNSSNCK